MQVGCGVKWGEMGKKLTTEIGIMFENPLRIPLGPLTLAQNGLVSKYSWRAGSGGATTMHFYFSALRP
jgi:hypothetical protein